MPNTYTPISSVVVGANAYSVDFTSIPATYTDLVIACNGQMSYNASLYMWFNNDNSVPTYFYSRLAGNGSSMSSAQTLADYQFISGLARTNATFNIYNIMNYANTSTFKHILCTSGTGISIGRATQGTWQNTAAINRITLSVFDVLPSGQRFTLYGIKAA